MSITRIIGIVLLVAGIIVLIFGAYNMISYSTSAGGKAANKIAGAFGTRTNVVQNSIIQICIGAGCAIVGFVIYRKS